jgi:hypothetical protein
MRMASITSPPGESKSTQYFFMAGVNAKIALVFASLALASPASDYALTFFGRPPARVTVVRLDSRNNPIKLDTALEHSGLSRKC